MPRVDERGTTVLEVVIVAAIMVFLLSVLMPPLRGYAGTATMRQASGQAVADFREAREIALTQHHPIVVWIHTVSTEGWQVVDSVCTRADNCYGPEGGLLYQYAVPNPAHVVGHCYVTVFGPTGQAYPNPFACPVGSAQNDGTTVTVLCIDNAASTNPEQTQIQITMASGEIQEVQSAGACV